jgi:hypothetical protein
VGQWLYGIIEKKKKEEEEEEEKHYFGQATSVFL